MRNARAFLAIDDRGSRETWEQFLRREGIDVASGPAGGAAASSVGVVVADAGRLADTSTSAGPAPPSMVVGLLPVEPDVPADVLLGLPRGPEPLRYLAEWLNAPAAGQEWRAALDPVADAVCLLDDSGRVERCNRAFPALLGATEDAVIGRRFAPLMAGWSGEPADVWEGRIRPGAESSSVARPGGRSVALTISARSRPTGEDRGVVVVLADESEQGRLRDQVAAAEATAAEREARIRELERDVKLHLGFSAAAAEGEPAQSLSRSAPDVFCDALLRYQQALELAVERANYRTDRDPSAGLRALARLLGSAHAGPRDVIELHSVALRNHGGNASEGRARAYAEEGRIVLLELMGHLVSSYRSRTHAAAPARQGPPHDGDPPR